MDFPQLITLGHQLTLASLCHLAEARFFHFLAMNLQNPHPNHQMNWGLQRSSSDRSSPDHYNSGVGSHWIEDELVAPFYQSIAYASLSQPWS